jgi:hypothetical protein
MYVDPYRLALLGVSPVPGPVLIPLYAQKTMDPVAEPRLPGLVVSQVIDIDPDIQSLVSLVLQVVDGSKFKRYAKETKTI